jgi:hypothetical protein
MSTEVIFRRPPNPKDCEPYHKDTAARRTFPILQEKMTYPNERGVSCLSLIGAVVVESANPSRSNGHRVLSMPFLPMLPQYGECSPVVQFAAVDYPKGIATQADTLTGSIAPQADFA